jgi:hypothetical protein
MPRNRDIRTDNSAPPTADVGGDCEKQGDIARPGIEVGPARNPHLSGSPSLEERQPAAGSSFAARFGRAIVQHGIAAIPSALFHYQGSLDLSAQEVWFISYVMCFKWDENLPRVNLSQMEKRVGMGKRSLYRLKDRLCEADYLTVFPVYTENGRQDSSAYDFSGLFAELERLILADPPKTNPIHTDDPDDDSDEEPVDHDMSFLARFGRVIARYGVAAVPQAIFTYQAALGLKPQQVWFVSYIFSYQWKKALPYPSIVKMSARTRYSTVQLHEIKASLVEFGYLRLVPRSTKYGGRDSNAYDFSGLFDALRAHLQRDNNQGKRTSRKDEALASQPTARSRPSRRRGRVAAQLATQKRRSAEGDSSLPEEGDSKLTWVGDAELSEQSDSQFLWEGGPEQPRESDARFVEESDTEFTEENDSRLTDHINRRAPSRVTPGLQKRVAQGLHNVEAIQEEKKRRHDSNHISPGEKRVRNQTNPVQRPSSTYITAILDDFSNELNDPDHKQSNVTQALRLWQASGLSEQQFVQRIYEAKQLTRQYQGKNGVRGIENKMAYFFAVLRDLCGLRDRVDSKSSAATQAEEDEQPIRSPSHDAQDRSMISARQLWQAALSELKAAVPAQSFQTWLKNTSIVAFDDSTIMIAVPSNFAKEWIETRYSRQIAETLYNLLGYKVQVCFEVRAPRQR